MFNFLRSCQTVFHSCSTILCIHQKCRGVPVSLVAVVQLLSHVQLFATPWTAVHQASLSFTISWSLFKHTSNESVMPSNCLILCLLLSSLAFSLSQHQGLFVVSRVFASGGQSWSFSISISPSNEYSGLISFRIDWFDLLVVQWTLKNLL